MVEYKVDAYLEHTKMIDALWERSQNGWGLVRIIECEPASGRDYVTLVWDRKAKDDQNTEKA